MGEVMNKIDIDDICDNISYLFYERDVSKLYMLDDKRILKLFNDDFLTSMVNSGFDIENKVLNFNRYVNNGIITPSTAVYFDKKFVGYVMPFFNGVSVYDAYDSGYFNNSLCKYALFFSKLENIILRNNKVVFTDLLSEGNVMVNANDVIKIIDFDDLQINNYRTPTMSSGLGKMGMYNNTKYMDGLLYTKQLDIKSLIYLYFYLVFNVDLSVVDNEDAYCYKLLYLNKVFSDIDLDDDVLIDKVLRLYDDDVTNFYLGDTLFKLSEKYRLADFNYDGTNIKKLVRR